MPTDKKLSYSDWMHGHNLTGDEKVKMLDCSYEDGKAIWDAALRCGANTTADATQEKCEQCSGTGGLLDAGPRTGERCHVCNGTGQKD